MRAEVRAERGTSEVSGWQEALESGGSGNAEPGAIDLVLAGDLRGARQHLRSRLGLGHLIDNHLTGDDLTDKVTTTGAATSEEVAA